MSKGLPSRAALITHPVYRRVLCLRTVAVCVLGGRRMADRLCGAEDSAAAGGGGRGTGTLYDVVALLVLVLLLTIVR